MANNDFTVNQWTLVIDNWASRTFQHNERGIVSHALREMVELGRAVGMTDEEITREIGVELGKPHKQHPRVGEEIADNLILMFCLAGYMDFDVSVLLQAKYEKNLARKWKPGDASGVSEHEDEAL